MESVAMRGSTENAAGPKRWRDEPVGVRTTQGVSRDARTEASGTDGAGSKTGHGIAKYPHANTLGFMAGKRGPKAMTDEHKAALERGRAEGRVVRDYLEGLRSSRPKRGRKRTAESVKSRLAKIEAEIADASAIEELQLVQERRDLTAELDGMGSGVALTDLEDAFVGVAKAYGARKGISYASWREVGVSAATLTRAGIGRGA
jgi:hypothetical protein